MSGYTAAPSVPCRGCEERRLGCHAGCERYMAFSHDLTACKAAHALEAGTARAAREMVIESAERRRRRRGLKR